MNRKEDIDNISNYYFSAITFDLFIYLLKID